MLLMPNDSSIYKIRMNDLKIILTTEKKCEAFSGQVSLLDLQKIWDCSSTVLLCNLIHQQG